MKSLPESIIFSCGSQESGRLAEGTPQCTCKKGSLTIEAAVIMPFLACFFALLLFFFRVMQVQLVVQDSLYETARTLALYAGAEEEISNAKYLALAKGGVAVSLSENENINQYVSGKVLGISLLESEFEGDEIFLKANYRMEFPISLLGKRSVYLHQQVCCRKWTGFRGSVDASEEAGYVYITETGTAYHKTKACPYLDLSIRAVDIDEVLMLRNESGQKYRECNDCADKNAGNKTVYITSYGECYHFSISCSGLKRTIYKIKLEDVGGRSKCRKCWN